MPDRLRVRGRRTPGGASTDPSLFRGRRREKVGKELIQRTEGGERGEEEVNLDLQPNANPSPTLTPKLDLNIESRRRRATGRRGRNPRKIPDSRVSSIGRNPNSKFLSLLF